MLDWIKYMHNDHPEFWKSYLAKFAQKSNRFVVISAVATGTSPSNDVLLSLGAVAVEHNAIIVKESIEMVLQQYKFLHENGLSNAYIIESELPKLGEAEAIQNFVDYLGNAILVGYRINNTLEMMNIALANMGCGRLRNEALDLEIMHRKLQDISEVSIPAPQLLALYKVPELHPTHTALQAYSLALLFLKLKIRLGIR
ncbi:MAG: 3'-5' exonuclease [Flavobacterium sp.]|nr:3'-5' exonuclease [Flavobacterium sp.]